MSDHDTTNPSPKIGLVLTGGGARAAYQVGVLLAIAEMIPAHARSPFSIICGTSAGAINAAGLAMSATHFSTGVRQLQKVWSSLHVGMVHRADLLGLMQNTLRLLGSLFSSGLARDLYRYWIMLHYDQCWLADFRLEVSSEVFMQELCMRWELRYGVIHRGNLLHFFRETKVFFLGNVHNE